MKRPGMNVALIVAGWFAMACAHAAELAEDTRQMPEAWAVHGQFTNVTQWHPGFASAYSGPNSLSSDNRHEETTDLTLFAGVRLWRGAEFWINPEIDEGFGLSNTLGVAGYPSGEAYKIGADHPYFRLPRAFLRQVFSLDNSLDDSLDGAPQNVPSAANQLAGSQSADNITLTAGKFSVVDVFDTNRYAHDPRVDFLNWAIVDAGAFDYAADAWGYSYGATAEWTMSDRTLRGGVFALSQVPNSTMLDRDFHQYALIGELEQRYQCSHRPGKVKLLGFVNRGRMANYADAVSLAQQTASIPDVSTVRRFASRPGIAANMEQELGADLGIFARASVNDGGKEAYEFTEINKSLSAGLSLQGDRWARHDDTVGLAVVVNALSGAAQRYFAAGGLGILIGDGRLTYGTERIVESYYAWHANPHFTLSADYQYVVNPAYNKDRGPVSLLGLRLHAEF